MADFTSVFLKKNAMQKGNNSISSLTKKKCAVYAESKFPAEYNGCLSLQYSPDGEFFAAAFGNGCVQIRNNKALNVQSILLNPNLKPMTCVRFHPNDNNILFSANLIGNIYLLKRKTLTNSIMAHEKNNEINTIDVNAAGHYLVSGGKDASVRIYDLHTNKQVLIFEGGNDSKKCHKMRIFVAKCHPENNEIFFTAGWDRCVKIWDARLRTGAVMTIRGPHICGHGIDIHDASILTASWSLNDSLQIYDSRTGDLAETIRPINKQNSIEGEFYYTCKFWKGCSSADVVLAGGSGTGFVDVIQRSCRKLKTRFKTNKTVLTIDTNEEGCIFSGMSDTIRGAFIYP